LVFPLFSFFFYGGSAWENWGVSFARIDSWQRGANENYNGLLKQYFPKKSNFKNINWRDVKKAERKLNNRPRKRLDFRSPVDVIN